MIAAMFPNRARQIDSALLGARLALYTVTQDGTPRPPEHSIAGTAPIVALQGSANKNRGVNDPQANQSGLLTAWEGPQNLLTQGRNEVKSASKL